MNARQDENPDYIFFLTIEPSASLTQSWSQVVNGSLTSWPSTSNHFVNISRLFTFVVTPFDPVAAMMMVYVGSTASDLLLITTYSIGHLDYLLERKYLAFYLGPDVDGPLLDEQLPEVHGAVEEKVGDDAKRGVGLGPFEADHIIVGCGCSSCDDADVAKEQPHIDE